MPIHLNENTNVLLFESQGVGKVVGKNWRTAKRIEDQPRANLPPSFGIDCG